MPRKIFGLASPCVLLLAAIGARLRADQAVPVVAPVGEIAGATVIEAAEDLDGFANSVVDIGDVDGDGLRDIAFLSRQISVSIEEGDNESRILFGSAALPARIDLADWPRWGCTLTATQRASCPIAGLGDLDGDGRDDIGFSGTFKGDRDPTHAAVIVFGTRSFPAEIDGDTFNGLRVARIHPDPALQGPRATGIQHFPSLAGGDFDGDGLRDVAAAVAYAPDPDSPASEGLVYIVPGSRPFPAEIHLDEVGVSMPGCRIRFSDEAQVRSPTLGFRLSVGDFDRDGADDLAILGPRMLDAAGKVTGQVFFVVFGRKPWPATLDLGDPRETGVCRISADNTIVDDRLPLRAVPDLDGDAVPDLLVPVAQGQWGYSTCALVSGWRLKPGVLRLPDVAVNYFTTTVVNGATEVVAPLVNWRGDGGLDLAFGQTVYSAAGPPDAGRVRTFSAAGGFPFPACIDDPRDGSVDVLGPTPFSRLGALVFGLDLDGDGRDELVASAPGLRSELILPPEVLAPMDGEHRGRIVIVHGDADLRGPLGGEGFDPPSSGVDGGGRLVVTGRGFDSATEVLFGDKPLEVIERPDSRHLTASIPSWPAADSVPVRLRRGTETFEFPAAFTFVVSSFPLQVDVNALGDRGATIANSPDHVCFSDFITPEVRGGHDFTGDGLDDIVFKMGTGTGGCQGKFYLLPGARDLPAEMPIDGIESRAAVITSEVHGEISGRGRAMLVGDLNGDGRSELAIATGSTPTAYIVFGHDIAPGTTTVQELMRKGLGCRVDFPDPVFFEAGDVNGDGLPDMGIAVTDSMPYEAGGAEMELGCVAFVLGRRQFPPVLDFAELPKVYGKPPAAGITYSYVTTSIIDGLGDVDGDGFDDVFFFCDGYVEEWPTSMGCYLVFGRPDWPLSTALDEEIARGSACLLAQEGMNTGVGPFLIGDQDRDGKADIGMNVNPDIHSGRGTSIRIVMGGSREKLAKPRSATKADNYDAIFPCNVNDGAGGVHGGRDFDGDGIPDILIQDTREDLAKPDRAIVLFGGDLKARAAPLDDVKGKLEVLNYEDIEQDPFPVASYYCDVDGDGHQDLVVASYRKLWIYYNPLRVLDFARPFRRGDANADGQIDLSDAIAILGWLFLGSAGVPCREAADSDDSGSIDITDAIFLLGSLFLGTEPLPPPYPDCGPDPTADEMGCADSPGCP